MPRAIVGFVRVVERANYLLGRFTLYLLFVLTGVLLWSIIGKAFGRPPLWTMETAQYVMTSYFVLGGAYSLQLGANVRMDLLYSRWTPRKQSAFDSVTGLAMVFFLGVILWGGIESSIYAFATGETSRSVWRPYMWPIKVTICFGVFMMILQSICYLIRDIARLRGKEI